MIKLRMKLGFYNLVWLFFFLIKLVVRDFKYLYWYLFINLINI